MKAMLNGVLYMLLMLGVAGIQIPRVCAQTDEEEVIVEEVTDESADEVAGEEGTAVTESTETESVEAEPFEEQAVEESVETAAVQAAPTGKFSEYTIIKGDCLWFIADRYYKNPFLWHQIHEANPYIKDPHWIYPHDNLIIPGITQKISGVPPAQPRVAPDETTPEAVAPTEEVPVAEAEEAVEAAALEEEAVEEISEAEEATEIEDEKTIVQEKTEEIITEGTKYESSSFVAPLDWQFDGYVIGEESQKLMVSQGDDIYIDIGYEQGMKPNTRCFVYRPGRRIKDKTSGQVLGRVVRKIAIVEAGNDIEAGVSTARVITSFDYIKPGDMVRIVKGTNKK